MAKLLKNFDKEVLRSHITSSLQMKEPTPHALMELSVTEHDRIRENCIHLKHLSLSDNEKESKYGSIEFGNNIRTRRVELFCDKKKTICDEIYLACMKKKLILITIDKEEAIRLLPNLIVTSSTYNSDPSGIVVLMLTVFKPINPNNKYWNTDDYKKIKKCKPNIIHSSNHHQSSGYYASFGNKGSFDKVVTSSVGQYTTKKKNTLAKQIPINIDATAYERMTAHEISRSVNDLSTIVPNIRSVISPVLEATYDLQSDDMKLNMKEVFTSKDGCWQSSLCINAITKEFHTEKDCTYTLISIPLQDCNHKKNKAHRYDFIFKINDRKHISIKLTPGTSFIFSGLYLTHHQNMSVDNETINESNFFNIASYGNKRLFTHLRKTINKLTV